MISPNGLPPFPEVPKEASMEQKKRIYQEYLAKLRKENEACDYEYQRRRPTSVQSYFEKRKNTRIVTNGLEVIIADDHKMFQSEAINFSLSGFALNLPHKFQVKIKEFAAVVYSKDKNFKLVVQPCWHTKIKSSCYSNQKVGFRIVRPQPSWIKFIQDMVPEEAVDVWGRKY